MERPTLGTRASRPHKAWHSRGYLPHLDQPALVQFVTFRLSDSVPAEVVAAWKEELAPTGREPADDPRCAELRQRIERYSDQGQGACWLRDERIAEQVEKTLLHFDGVRYRLLAWVVMPNHVHALLETLPGVPARRRHPLVEIVQCQTGEQDTGTERSVLDAGLLRSLRPRGKHFVAATEYIEQNPVKAGLVRSANDWQWAAQRGRMRARRPRSQGADLTRCLAARWGL